MLNAMIAAGTGTSLNRKKPSKSSSEEIQFLYLIIKAIDSLNSTMHNIYPSAPAAFTVGTTTGAPTNGQSSWTISTINVIGKNPLFLKNGVPQTNGADYTFNDATGVYTLATGTFATSQVWTVIY
jgi:hypothetical protein